MKDQTKIVRLSRNMNYEVDPISAVSRGLVLHLFSLAVALAIAWAGLGSAHAVPWLIAVWAVWIIVSQAAGFLAWHLRWPRAYRPMVNLIGGDAFMMLIGISATLAGPGSPWLQIVLLILWCATVIYHVRASRKLPLKPLVTLMRRTKQLVRAKDGVIEWRGIPLWDAYPSYEEASSLDKVMLYIGPIFLAGGAQIIGISFLMSGARDLGIMFIGISFCFIACGLASCPRFLVVTNRTISGLEDGTLDPGTLASAEDTDTAERADPMSSPDGDTLHS